MSYPDYPKNRLIVGNVDLTEKYGMILSDGYSMNPPEPKTYSVDIPCGDGSIDLTDALRGRAVYKNRSMEFTFYVINVDNVEFIKSAISSFLHGKAYDFKLSMDPGYIYHGRFTVSDFNHGMYDVGRVVSMKVTVDADPYKRCTEKFRFSAVGGTIQRFLNGSKLVSPTIKSGGDLKVIFNNRIFYIKSNSWSSDNLRFNEGVNEVYFNSYPIHNLTWGNVKDKNITWGAFKKKRLFEWYKSVGIVDDELAEEVIVTYDWSGI